jgi:(S)-2-hydroxyglutarate dehydrogenase
MQNPTIVHSIKLLDLQTHYNVAIIGGGILGTSIAYFLSSYVAPTSKYRIILFEQERNVAFHTSNRNTGKVHAPFLYDPLKKKLFAKAAFLGFNMLKEYCKIKSLPFKEDGVLQVATYDKAIDELHKYIDWGYSNGLEKDELKFLEKDQVARIEPNIKCLSAIYCSKDGSVDYGQITRQLIQDAQDFGCKISTGRKVSKIHRNKSGIVLHTNKIKIKDDNIHDNNNRNQTEQDHISVNFLINAAGGNAVDIAHRMELATEYTDLHFRGEYWQAPIEYKDLTKMSVYSVPKYPEYPFLDPHWIVRIDGRREVGPNAVPVFGPYAYNLSNNLRYFIPKIFESSRGGALNVLKDRQFLALASNELKSSLSKTAMINRARDFLPALTASKFNQRGTSGIRSSLIDRYGKFLPDTLVLNDNLSLHVLNYNSPGATGALPMAAMIVSQLIDDGIVAAPTIPASENGDSTFIYGNKEKIIWDPLSIAEQMKS